MLRDFVRCVFAILLTMVLFLSCEKESVDNLRNNREVVDSIGETKIGYDIQSIDRIMVFPDISSKSTRQGCAYYDGILLIFHDTNDVVEVYDMNALTLKGIVNMGEIGLCNKEYHCNNANFGKQKYDANDYFPLLYVSMEHLNQHKILVFRITGDHDNLNFKLVQIIVLPEPSQISLYYPNCYIDTLKESIWVSGYSTNSYQSSESNRLKYIRYNLPDRRDGDVIVLKAEDIQQINEFNSITATQGGCIYNGMLFQVFGIYAPRHFVVFNLIDSAIISDNLLDIVDYEPEGLFVKDDALYYTTEDCVLKINFVK